MKKLAPLALASLLLVGCSDSSEAEPETETAASPAQSVSAPTTEQDLIAWVEGREGFNPERDDATDFLDGQATRTYQFWCSRMDSTNLPSEVLDRSADQAFADNPAWGVGSPAVDANPSDELNAIYDLERLRPLQFEVATTVECSQHKEAFESWSADQQ